MCTTQQQLNMDYTRPGLKDISFPDGPVVARLDQFPGNGSGSSNSAIQNHGYENHVSRRASLRITSPKALIAFAVIVVFAVLFVGWEVAERHLFPEMSIGVRHALLTMRAGVATAAASVLVYMLMRNHQRRLASTAERITDLLESYTAKRSLSQRFENSSLLHCREVLSCDRHDCVMYHANDRRCWQEVALRQRHSDYDIPDVSIQQCHECEVYRIACPDKLTELGESFNNLMFLLEVEARQVGSMRAQMVEKEKMVAIGQMASGIAHEVCNPLSSISSIVQMLKRTGSIDPGSEELELIETHIRRITSTVRQMVSLARPSELRWQKADVGDNLEEAIRLIKFDRRAKNVDVVFTRPDSLPLTYVLSGQLEQVFINLSLNALDAMPEGGKLTIDAKKDHGCIVVEIEDTGCGIESGVGRRVFEPFFTTKEPGRGTGLGLAVSYSIVRKHGGSLDFESTPHKGTVFRVELPILKEIPSA